MAPSRRRSTTAQKKTTTMPSKRGEQAEKATEQEFESELSGAFSLLSVEGSPSKVRTSDLGKLLLAIGAGEIAEMKPLESIVDINHSGFFTREKVTAALQKLREQGRFPSLDELSGRSASGKRASTVAKNKQQQNRLNDEEHMNQNQMNNASKKILVVDDIGLCRRITTNQLEQLGFKDSPVATSGKEAIQYIDEKQGEVQCILLDIMMPQENGVETLAEIRKHEKFRREHLEPGHEEEEPIKVIAVTALKHGEVLSLCESTGEAGHSVMFDGYIEKPATLTKIRDAMETAAIMFASSLPSGLDQKTRKINNNNNNNSTKNLATLAAPAKVQRGNSDGGSGGSDPITDGGGSGGRGGSNEGTDTRNKGSNEVDNGTSSDEKGQTQSKGLGGKMSAKAGKEKKQDQIDKLKKEEEVTTTRTTSTNAQRVRVWAVTKFDRRIREKPRRRRLNTIWKSTAVTNATWEEAISRKGHTSTKAITPPPATKIPTAYRMKTRRVRKKRPCWRMFTIRIDPNEDLSAQRGTKAKRGTRRRVAEREI